MTEHDHPSLRHIQQSGVPELLTHRLLNAGLTREQLEMWRKSSADLVKEIIKKESRLEFIDDSVRRYLRVAKACIRYSAPDSTVWLLREAVQIILPSNRDPMRLVYRDSNVSVSEKIEGCESPLGAILRGVEEELGVSGGYALYELDPYDGEEKVNTAYQGLITEARIFPYNIIFGPDAYMPNGTFPPLPGDQTEEGYAYREISHKEKATQVALFQWVRADDILSL